VFTRSEKTNNGQVPIVDLVESVRLIRLQEMVKRGLSTQTVDDEDLRRPEKIKECPFWYYLESGQMLLNGSDQAAAGVEPTKVAISDIIQAIKVGARPFRIAQTSTSVAKLGNVVAASK